MDQRVSLITLAVSDMDRAAAFYTALGWKQVLASTWRMTLSGKNL